MKKIIIILSIIYSSIAFSTEAWKVVKTNDDFFIVNEAESIKHEANLNGSNVTFKQVKKHNDNIDLIIYDSGSAGTKVIVALDRAIIFDKKNKKVLGDFPYQYRVISESTYGFDQPVWNFQKDSITITDDNSGLKQSVKLQ